MNRRELLRTMIVAGSTGGLGALAGCTKGGGGGYGGSGGGSSSKSSTSASGGMNHSTVSVTSSKKYGDILVGLNGKSLYLFEKDSKGSKASSCSGSCAKTWPPLTVSGKPTKGNGVTASLSTLKRKDGSMQVMAAGWPLYQYSADKKPGDTNGEEVSSFGAKWYLLAPDGTKKEPKEEGGSKKSGKTKTTTSSGY